MPTAQNFKNHTRFDPVFHFIVAPVLIANFIVAIVRTVHDWPRHPGMHVWHIVVALALILLAGIARGYALKTQDRTIRLEERLRYTALLTPAGQLSAQSLTLKQIVALRFASDAELPTLLPRALAESLTPKQIKQAITHWRPDNDRV